MRVRLSREWHCTAFVCARRFLRLPSSSAFLTEESVRASTRNSTAPRQDRALPERSARPSHDGLSLDPTLVERVLETRDTSDWLSERRFSVDATASASPSRDEPQAAKLPTSEGGHAGEPNVDAPWTWQRAEGVLARYRKWLHLSSDSHLFSSSGSLVAVSDDALEDVRGCLDYILRSDPSQRSNSLHHAAQLAYMTGFHRRCLDLFLSDHRRAVSAMEQAPLAAVGKSARAAAVSRSGDGDGVVVPSYVFAAALQCHSCEALMQIARLVLALYPGHGAHREGLTAAQAAGAEEALLTPAQTREGVYEVQALRLYAHCVCALARLTHRGQHHHHHHHRQRGQGGGVTCSSGESVVSFHDSGDAFAHVIAEVADECAARLFNGLEPRTSTDKIVHTSVRHVLYAGNDDGAAHAALFLRVFQLWAQHAAKQSQGQSCPSTSRAWLSASLLSTAFRYSLAEKRWDHLEYYSLYLDAFFHEKSSRGTTTLTRQEDTLVLGMMRFTMSTRQWSRCRSWVHHVTRQFPDYLPSIEVATQAARAAVTTSDASLATWALETVLAAGQLAPPSSSDLLACLSAVARCGLHTFPEVLQSCIDSGLVQLNEEELLHVQLLHCRRGVRWREEVEALLSAFHVQCDGTRQAPETAAAAAAPPHMDSFSSRNLYQLLLVLQEGEHPHFMLYYRHFLATFADQMGLEERARWAIFALTWVTLRCGNVSVEDTLYTAQEVLQLWGVDRGMLPSHDGATLSTDTRRSLLTKWGILKSQHSDAWWKQQLKGRKRHVGPRTSRSSSGGTDAMDVVAVFLSSAADAVSAVAVPAAARFLKRPSLVQLGHIQEW